MKCSIFPGRSDEGKAFAETLLDRLQGSIPSIEIDDSTINSPVSRVAVLEACASDDLVLFDATVELEPTRSNYPVVIGPLRHLYHVILFSRTRLPQNMQGVHNLLSPSFGSPDGMFYPQVTRESLLSWVCDRAESVAIYQPDRRKPDVPLKDDLNAASLVTVSAVVQHALTLSPGKTPGLREELGRFLFAYQSFCIGALGLTRLNDEAQVQEMAATMFGRIFERIVAEHRLGADYPSFREGVRPLERLIRRSESIRATGTQGWRELLIKLLLTQPLVKALHTRRNWFRRLELNSSFDDLQGQIIAAVAEQTAVYARDADLRSVTEPEAIQLAELIRAAQDCGPKDTLDCELMQEDEELPAAAAGPSSALGELILAGIHSNEQFSRELRRHYTRFVSYRTSTFSRLPKSAGDYIVNPQTFSAPNEVFTLRLRFHLMRLLYESVIRLNRFGVYASEDYLNSWWTCFELLAFVNARPGNEQRVEMLGSDIKLDCSRFLISREQQYKLQRFLLYSNPLILEEEHVEHVLPAIRNIFGRELDLARGGIWDAISAQCIHSGGFSGVDELLALSQPYQVFIPAERFCTDTPMDCPSHGAALCPRRRETKPCALQFERGNDSARRFVWRDTEPAERSIQGMDVYYLVDR